ncbi:hypothetical protein E3G68_005041 [Mycobacteroides abscessus]|uniref:hypothetical protein n=1 Tax=Mycobacteroides abscessus TaxID=36809 RepID=UPI0018787BCC|nr:hypothetical protein [Mycobacteroides abscessus]
MPEASKRSSAERRSYTSRRAERTASTARKTRTRWTITDARVALDLSLSVPEAAIQVGRTATAVENLRRKWRLGQLAAGLADQVPPPPRASTRGKGTE